MPEKSVSSVGKFTETKNVSVNFVKNTERNDQSGLTKSNDSSGSESVCSSTSDSSIQTQVSQ